MLEEFKKSISDIFYERLSSPLYGSFIVSWLLWNWKIPYVSIFVDADKLEVNKIEFIVREAANWKFLILYPAISTFVLIVVMPFLAIGAFWISLKFDNWRRNIKNKIEDKQLLSLEQSIELRTEIRKQSERYAQMLGDKDKEIADIKTLLETVQQNKNPDVPKNFPEKKVKSEGDERYRDDYDRISKKQFFISNFRNLSKRIQDGNVLAEGYFPSDALTFFIANDLITKSGSSGRYEFTEKGRFFLKYYVNEIS